MRENQQKQGLEEALASNSRIFAELQNQTKNQKQIGDLEIWLATQIIAMDSLQHSSIDLEQKLKVTKESALKFQIELEGERFWLHFAQTELREAKQIFFELTQILDELCAEDSQTFKKSEYNFIKSEYHQMKAWAKDADMVLNWLEEYNRIKMELITLLTEMMVYRQKIK